MKVNIKTNCHDDEIIINCQELTPEVQDLYQKINKLANATTGLVFYKDNKEYYLSLNQIIFFETADHLVYAHTKDDMYLVKHRLYELEKVLPGYFIRVSKSSILNINLIYSISYNLASASLVQFVNSHKQIYVSRKYYKQLKEKLLRRN